MGTRRALACKLHLGEQLRSQSLHPGRGAGGSLLRPASQLLPVAQHVHQRAHEILCELEGYNFTINDISTRTGDLCPISKGKGFYLSHANCNGHNVGKDHVTEVLIHFPNDPLGWSGFAEAFVPQLGDPGFPKGGHLPDASTSGLIAPSPPLTDAETTGMAALVLGASLPFGLRVPSQGHLWRKSSSGS